MQRGGYEWMWRSSFLFIMVPEDVLWMICKAILSSFAFHPSAFPRKTQSIFNCRTLPMNLTQEGFLEKGRANEVVLSWCYPIYTARICLRFGTWTKSILLFAVLKIVAQYTCVFFSFCRVCSFQQVFSIPFSLMCSTAMSGGKLRIRSLLLMFIFCQIVDEPSIDQSMKIRVNPKPLEGTNNHILG